MGCADRRHAAPVRHYGLRPAGIIIAHGVDRRVSRAVDARLGVVPDQAERFGAATAEGIEELLARPEDTDDDTNPQERARAWQAAVEQHGDVKVQAEALGPAAWAQLIAEAIDDVLANANTMADTIKVADLARALAQRRDAFAPAERLMTALRFAYDDVADEDDPVRALAERLGLDLPPDF